LAYLPFADNLHVIQAVNAALANSDALNLRRAGERFSVLPTV